MELGSSGRKKQNSKCAFADFYSFVIEMFFYYEQIKHLNEVKCKTSSKLDKAFFCNWDFFLRDWSSYERTTIIVITS